MLVCSPGSTNTALSHLTAVLASWKYTGLIPLDPAVISNSLKHRFTSYSTIQDQFNKIRELVLGCSPGGEAESISSIFQLACKISPIYQLLDDQAQKDLEGRCKTCGRKDKRAKISLQHLHDGCCLTAADIVVEVETVHAQRQLRKEFAEAKLVERNAAKESKQMALFNPMNTQWDPNHLTKAELLKALHARGLTEPNVGRAPVLSDAKPLLVKLVKATNISIDMFDHPLRKLPVEVMSLLRVDASLMCSAASDGEEEEEDDEDFVEAEEEEQASTLRSLASANSQSGYLASAQSSSIRSTPSPSSPAPCAEITGSSFGLVILHTALPNRNFVLLSLESISHSPTHSRQIFRPGSQLIVLMALLTTTLFTGLSCHFLNYHDKPARTTLAESQQGPPCIGIFREFCNKTEPTTQSRAA